MTAPITYSDLRAKAKYVPTEAERLISPDVCRAWDVLVAAVGAFASETSVDQRLLVTAEHDLEVAARRVESLKERLADSQLAGAVDVDDVDGAA